LKLLGVEHSSKHKQIIDKISPRQFSLHSSLTTMASVSDISSVSWTEESFENQSSTDTDSSATDKQIKEKLPTQK